MVFVAFQAALVSCSRYLPTKRASFAPLMQADYDQDFYPRGGLDAYAPGSDNVSSINVRAKKKKKCISNFEILIHNVLQIYIITFLPGQ